MAGRAGHFLGIGGAEEDRTPDLCIANAALSQLSYRPVILLARILRHSIGKHQVKCWLVPEEFTAQWFAW